MNLIGRRLGAVVAVSRWAVASNERALANARVAATECSRSRLEHAEVELFLASLAVLPTDRERRAVRAGR